MESGFLVDGVEFFCALCAKPTLVCRKCWYNQRYCSKVCSSKSRRRSADRSQLRYSHTIKGRKNQKLRDNTYRNKNTTTEHTPKVEVKRIEETVVIEAQCCSRCGLKLERIILFAHLVSRSLRRHFAHTRGSG